MPKILKKHFLLALENVAKYGDTDIFPFPIENHAIHDTSDAFSKELLKAQNAFKSYFSENPPSNLSVRPEKN